MLERGAAAAEGAGADLHGVRCFALLGRARSAVGDVAGASDALARTDDIFRRVVLPPDRTFVFASDAYIAAALLRAAMGDATEASANLVQLIGAWERDGFREAVAEGRLAEARLARITGDHAARVPGGRGRPRRGADRRACRGRRGGRTRSLRTSRERTEGTPTRHARSSTV